MSGPKSAAEWLADIERSFLNLARGAHASRSAELIVSLAAMLRDAKAELDGIPARLEELAKHLRAHGPGGEPQRIAEHDACLIAAGHMKDRWDAIEAKWREGGYK